LPREERRASLLDAAREVFAESGYHAAAMDDIAGRAGVTKPVLYQHFGSKQELYLAVFDAGVEDVIAAVGKGLSSSPDNRARVTATMDAYLGFMSEQDAAHQLVFTSDLVNLPAVRDRLERLNSQIANLVSQVIAEDTGLPPSESCLLAYGLIGLAQTAAKQWLQEPGAMSRAEAAQLLASLAWRGISGFPKYRPPVGPAPVL
jgi:AcrR family transcriptional regulator